MICMRKIAALFVDEEGVYSGLEDVDVWGVNRDARMYSGPHPVVAHPPCERWGSFWKGSIRKGARRFDLGDDGGCFESALNSVRKFGGVLEHPANSRAWGWFGISTPSNKGGWELADSHGGFTCCVWQGWYGHRAPKPTWLYACLSSLPAFVWGQVKKDVYTSQFRGQYPQNCDMLFPDKEVGGINWTCLSAGTGEKSKTPIPFRDILISIARSVSSDNVPATLFDMDKFVVRKTEQGVLV